MKSSHIRRDQILGVISPMRAEAVLTDWANLPGPWPLEDMSNDAGLKFRDAMARLRRRHKAICGDSRSLGHLWLRDMLRRAWDASDMRERDWLLFRFRDSYAAMERRGDMPSNERMKEDFTADVTGPRYFPPPVTAVEAAAFYLQRNFNRARHCLNPDCPAPYFIVSKKGQRYCSEECAKPAQREAKRKWWTEHRGKEASKRGATHKLKDNQKSDPRSTKEKPKKRAAPMSSAPTRR